MNMEQTLKYVGNSAMLTVPAHTIRKRNIDRNTRFELIEGSQSDDDVVSFRIIRPAALAFPKLKEPLKMSPEIESLISDPVYPSEEDLQNARIQHLLDEDFR